MAEVELAVEGLCASDGLLEVVLAREGDWGTGEPLLERFRGESMPRLVMLGIGDGTGAVAKVTILMPLLVLVLAGMNRLVWLFAAGIPILFGWFELHPGVVSCVPVE